MMENSDGVSSSMVESLGRAISESQEQQVPFEDTEVMSRKRQSYTPEFKVQVVLEALRHNVSIADLAQRFGVHQTLIFVWRRQAIEGLVGIFERRHDNRTSDPSEVKRLHAKIGELLVERDTLAKKTRR